MNQNPAPKFSAKKILKIVLVVSFLLFVFLLLPLQIPWNSSVDRFIAGKYGFTRSDAPRTPSGMIDITKITNDKLAEGITAENNIVVDYVQIFKGEPVSAEFEAQLLRRLQMNSADGPHQWTKWEYSDDTADEFDMALSQPWLASENQLAHDWITANNDALDQLVTASHKPRYYHPLISENSEDTLSCQLPYAQQARSAARGLTARALNRVALGDLDAALADVAATRRLGTLMQQGGTLVENLVGMAMVGIAVDAESKILASGKLTDQQCADYRKTVSLNTGWGSLASTIKTGERAFHMDAIQRFEGQSGFLESIGLEPSNNLAMLSKLRRVTDWEQAAQISDEFTTRMNEALEVKDDADRLQRLKDLEIELQEIQARSESFGEQAAIFLGAGARGRIAGEACIVMLSSSIRQIEKAAIRTRQHSDFSDLGFAIEQYRIANGSFPNDLSELTPKFISKLPIDRFTGNAPRYELMTDRTGYRLSSTSEDKIFDSITPLDEAETGIDALSDTSFTVVIE